jgi:hypothetical protein
MACYAPHCVNEGRCKQRLQRISCGSSSSSNSYGDSSNKNNCATPAATAAAATLAPATAMATTAATATAIAVYWYAHALRSVWRGIFVQPVRDEHQGAPFPHFPTTHYLLDLFKCILL